MTRRAGESGPCSAWVMRSAATRRGSAGGVGEDHPLRRAGREVDPDLAADLDLGGRDPGVARADDAIDGLRCRRPAARTQARRSPGRRRRRRAHRPRAGRPHRGGPGGSLPSRSAGEATTIAPDARDPGRDDGHDERRRIRRGAARDVAPTRASGVQRRSISMPGAIGRAASIWALGLGEPADVGDGLVEGAAGSRGSRASRAAAQVRGDRGRAGRPAGRRRTAALAARTAHRRARGRRRGSSRAASRTAGSGTAPRRTRASPVARRPPGRRRRRRRGRGAGGGGPATSIGGRVAPRSARHGTIFSIGRTRIPDAPAALSRGSRPQTSSAPTTEWMAIMPVVGERDDRRRFEGRQQRLELRRAARRARSSSGTCDRARR